MPSPLHDQTSSLGELVREQTWLLEDRMRKLIPTPVQHAARQIVLTGSGDSAIAALAGEQAMRELVGVPALALPSLPAARYLFPLFDRERPVNPLVFAISNSGEVARLVEAAQNARAGGGVVVALTGDGSSRLARASDYVLDTAVPAFPPSPGMRTYVQAVLAVQLFAIRLAEVRARITMDEAQALRHELASLGDILDRVVADTDDRLAAVASEWADLPAIEVLGSGPSAASAAFTSAKVLEASGKRSAAIDVEEFVHLQYFERDAARTGTILFAPAGSPVLSRSREVEQYLSTLARPTLVIGKGHTQPTIPLPSVREIFAPILHAAVAGLFASHLAEATGEEDGRGSVGQWADSHAGGTTRNSEILAGRDRVPA